MKACTLAFLMVIAACAAGVSAQQGRRSPHIGFVYPAGGQQGTTIHVLVGGQYLRGAADAYISGEGVRASVIQYYPPLRNLDRKQREELARRLGELIEKRWADLAEEGRVDPNPPWRQIARKRPSRPKTAGGAEEARTEAVELPAHPLLSDLEKKDLRALLHVRNEFSAFGKRQPNAQIAESVLVEVTIGPRATPGDRELRLRTRLGLTNPIVFQVGTLAETREQEPDDPAAFGFLPEEPPLRLPILVNGQIMPGDIDRLRFHAQRGQTLVIEAQARRLIPYLADAVPGWFQATLALFNAEGDEVAFVDDYRFDPDPVLFYEVPEDGAYELEIRDSIYRGREDFVYRISMGEQPFITSVFPLGTRARQRRSPSVDGWNLPNKPLWLDYKPGAGDVRHTRLRRGEHSSNSIVYAVDTLRDTDESEPNDTAENARRIGLPVIVNGCITHPDDIDTFRFEGRAGDEVVAEVTARRLQSPLDSLLRLTDSSGRVLDWNDDYEHKDGFLHRDMGLLTHHADSYLRTQLPANGVYYVQLTDVQNHGGEAYGYRLRIGPPRPDFALRLTPSSINMFAGTSTPVCVHVLRRDGFDGEVELVLKDAPRGFRLSGARIPAGRDRVRMTLTAPPRPIDDPIILTLEGRARIDGRTVNRPVIPAEDMMQAFLYRHLTPSHELMAAVIGGRRFGRPVEVVSKTPIRIPAGGTARVRIAIPDHPQMRDIQLELNEPPEGIALENVTVVPDGLMFQLTTRGNTIDVGFADNLIVDAFMDVAVKNENGDATGQTRRVFVGVLPAIPFEVVQR